MKLLAGHDEAVIAWAERMGRRGRVPDIALGVLDDGLLVGALILQKENPHTWELEVYGRVSKDCAQTFFDGIFNRAGVYRLEIKTTRDNKKVRKAAPKWGFTWEGVRRHYFGPNDDALCWYMTPDKCRWIERNG